MVIKKIQRKDTVFPDISEKNSLPLAKVEKKNGYPSLTGPA